MKKTNTIGSLATDGTITDETVLKNVLSSLGAII